MIIKFLSYDIYFHFSNCARTTFAIDAYYKSSLSSLDQTIVNRETVYETRPVSLYIMNFSCTSFCSLSLTAHKGKRGIEMKLNN